MLSPSYAAIKQFKSQISHINTFRELNWHLKTTLSASELSLSMRISSPTVWVLDWDVDKNSVSGTLELKLEPTLNIGKDAFQMKERTFLLQDPNPNSLGSLEARLISFIKQSIDSIYFDED